MTLQEAIQKINPDENLAIYAVEPFTPESEARYGPISLKNRGELNGKILFANGIYCHQCLNQNAEGLSDDEAVVKMICLVERLRVRAQTSTWLS